MSKTRAVATVGSHCDFSVVAVKAVWFCGNAEARDFVDLLLEDDSWVTDAVTARGTVDCIEVLDCLIWQALLWVFSSDEHLNFVFFQHVGHAIHHLAAVGRRLPWLTWILDHLKGLTGVTLSTLRRLWHTTLSHGLARKSRRQIHLILLQLLLLNYLLKMILNLALRCTSRASIERTFLCLELTVSFIVSCSFDNLMWFDGGDGFVIAVTAQFLLLELEYVGFKRWDKFLLWWILFVKTEIRTTSMSRCWILLLYLLQTN